MDIMEMESYIPTCEALSIIYGVQESDTDVFKSFVYAGYLMESGAPKEMVMEGVSDVFTSIVNAIKQFIERIKEFFKKILLYITAAWADLDKVAEEVKPLIKDKNFDFEIDGYKFTVLDKSGPNITEFQNLVSEYNSDMEEISKLKDAEIKKKVNDWLAEDHIEKLRGNVLGSGGAILEDEFLDTIRKYYRGDADSTEKIKVDNSMVNTIIGHAKKLEDVKKSAIKDRDNLVLLLSKTEAFFDKSLPTLYKGSTMKANIASIDVSDNHFSKTDNYRNVTDASMKIVSSYATLKSRQVNKIASMINLVACERVTALRDQIKQERTILRQCLFGGKDERKLEEAVAIFPEGYEGRDYVTYAMESTLQDFRYHDMLAKRVLLEEATFLSESMKEMRIHYLMEADMDKDIIGKAKNAIGQIIEAVVSAFRKKAIGDANKYKPWIDEIKDGLAEKAKNKKKFKMANFGEANYAAMASTIVNSIKTAYASKNYDDTTFAKNIINSFTSFDKVNDDSSRDIMLNYFRTGTADTKLDTVTMSGADLAGKVPAMVKYISEYGSTVTKPSENISSAFKSASDAFKVTEAFTNLSYLDLVGRAVCETEVTACVDYGTYFGGVSLDQSLLVDYGMMNTLCESFVPDDHTPVSESKFLIKDDTILRNTHRWRREKGKNIFLVVGDGHTSKGIGKDQNEYALGMDIARVNKAEMFIMGWMFHDDDYQAWTNLTKANYGLYTYVMSKCKNEIRRIRELNGPSEEYPGIFFAVFNCIKEFVNKHPDKRFVVVGPEIAPLSVAYPELDIEHYPIMIHGSSVIDSSFVEDRDLGNRGASIIPNISKFRYRGIHLNHLREKVLRAYPGVMANPTEIEALIKGRVDSLTESSGLIQKAQMVGLLEAEDTKIGGKTEGIGGDAGKGMSQAQKAAGSEGGAEEKKSEGDMKSATQVQSEDKEGTGTGEQKTNNAAVTYKRNVDRFFKNCITLYIKAREEQFLAYINALADIDGARPKFDKNGKYISKEKAEKDDTEAVKTESK